MATQTTETMSNMLRQAADAFQTAFQTGTKLQQEAIRIWTQPFMGDRSLEEIRAQGQKLAEASLKLVQKNVDESQRLLDAQCQHSIELLRKAFETAKPEKADVFEVTRSVWQQSLDAMRTSVEEITKANAQVMENWTSFLSNSFNGHDRKTTGAPANK